MFITRSVRSAHPQLVVHQRALYLLLVTVLLDLDVPLLAVLRQVHLPRNVVFQLLHQQMAQIFVAVQNSRAPLIEGTHLRRILLHFEFFLLAVGFPVVAAVSLLEEVFEGVAAVEVEAELGYLFHLGGTQVGLHCFLCFALLGVALAPQLTENRKLAQLQILQHVRLSLQRLQEDSVVGEFIVWVVFEVDVVARLCEGGVHFDEVVFEEFHLFALLPDDGEYFPVGVEVVGVAEGADDDLFDFVGEEGDVILKKLKRDGGEQLSDAVGLFVWDEVVVVFGAEFEFELLLFFGIVGADIMHCRRKYIIIGNRPTLSSSMHS